MNVPLQRSTLITACLLSLLVHAQAQTPAADPSNSAISPTQLDKITVTASRTPVDVASVARSMTIFNRQTIERELATKPDLGALLSTVPGIGMSIEGRSNATGQDMIRGRRIQVLVDGVAQDQPFLDFRQDFQNVSLDTVERIEVLRGGSALYGLGATGGIVNIITKQPRPGPLRAGVLLNLSPSSNSNRAGFDLSGSAGMLNYRLGYSQEQRGVREDAAGRDIPTANLTSDYTRSKNLDLKLALDIDAEQRLAFSANRYSVVETGRLLAVGGNAVAGVRASAVPFPIGVSNAAVNARVGGMDQPAPLREVNNYSLIYEHSNVWGNAVSLTAYQMSRTEETATLLFNRYVNPVGSSSALVAPNLRGFGQNLPENRRKGLRATVETPLSRQGLPALLDAKLVWGADFDRQSYIQPNNARGAPGFVSNTSPDIAQKSAAGFAQLDGKLGAVNLSGGLRHESVDVDIPTFTVANTSARNRGNLVTGGTVNFSKTLANVGAVWAIDPAFRPFASYGQSFALGEILRAVRSTAATSIATSTELQPQVVNTFEIGARGRLGEKGMLAYTVAAFQARSKLGATFAFDPLSQQTTVERAPERTHGFEATLDYSGIENWKLGGTLAIQEGFRTFDGVERRLPGTRIAPTKLYGYADWVFATGWNARLDVTHGRGRDYFAANSTVSGEGRVQALTLTNFTLVYDAKKFGNFSLGISNLMNKNYVPQPLQALNQSDRYYAGEGRAFRLTYRNSF